MAHDAFLSHAWRSGTDPTGTHQRVVCIAAALRERGWSVWLDADELHGCIDRCLVDGITRSHVVVVFLTREYMTKVNAGYCDDACVKELNYATFLRRTVVPVVLDPTLLDVAAWPPGVVAMKFGGTLYVDGCVPIAQLAQRIDQRLRREGLVPRARPRGVAAARPRPRCHTRTPSYNRLVLPTPRPTLVYL